jgi:hypothetical protein
MRSNDRFHGQVMADGPFKPLAMGDIRVNHHQKEVEK